MNALQHTNHCGTQSYLIKDIPALKKKCNKNIRESGEQLPVINW
jgi:hypothetical protein